MGLMPIYRRVEERFEVKVSCETILKLVVIDIPPNRKNLRVVVEVPCSQLVSGEEIEIDESTPIFVRWETDEVEIE